MRYILFFISEDPNVVANKMEWLTGKENKQSINTTDKRGLRVKVIV